MKYTTAPTRTTPTTPQATPIPAAAPVDKPEEDVVGEGKETREVDAEEGLEEVGVTAPAIVALLNKPRWSLTVWPSEASGRVSQADSIALRTAECQ